jgi:hypothetical protein
MVLEGAYLRFFAVTGMPFIVKTKAVVDPTRIAIFRVGGVIWEPKRKPNGRGDGAGAA